MAKNEEKRNIEDKVDPATVQLNRLADAVKSFSQSVDSGNMSPPQQRGRRLESVS